MMLEHGFKIIVVFKRESTHMLCFFLGKKTHAIC